MCMCRAVLNVVLFMCIVEYMSFSSYLYLSSSTAYQDGKTALIWASAWGHVSCVQALINAGASIETTDSVSVR